MKNWLSVLTLQADIRLSAENRQEHRNTDRRKSGKDWIAPAEAPDNHRDQHGYHADGDQLGQRVFRSADRRYGETVQHMHVFFKQHDGAHEEQAIAAGSVKIMISAASLRHASGSAYSNPI